VLTKVDNQFVDRRLPECVQIDQGPEFAQRATDTLVLESQLLDFSPMCGGNEWEQAAFFAVDVVTKAPLELRPHFADVHWVTALEGARQLRQALLEHQVVLQQPALDPARRRGLGGVSVRVGHNPRTNATSVPVSGQPNFDGSSVLSGNLEREDCALTQFLREVVHAPPSTATY